MEETDEGGDLRAALESALTARADELAARPEAYSMIDIRRLLEVDAKLEPNYLDEHKDLVSKLLGKVFCKDDSGDEQAEDQDMVADEVEASKKDEEEVRPAVVARKEEVLSKPAPLTDQIVEAAVAKRAAYVRDNAQTLTMSGFRRLLESELKLEEKQLDSFKSLIKRLVDKALVEEVPPPVSAKKQTKDTDAANLRKPKKGEDADTRPATSKKRELESVKSKSVKKPVKRGRVESSDEDEHSEDERDHRRPAMSKQAKGKARKRAAVDSDRSEDGSDHSGDEDRKESRQKRAKVVAEKGSSRLRKPAAPRNSVSGSEEDVGDERSGGSRKNQKEKTKTKSNEREDSVEGAESDGGSKKSQGRKGVNEQKPMYGKQVEHLRSLIKACGMNVSPSIYKKAKNAPGGKQEAVLAKELESLLEREGLTPQATEKEIKAVRRKKDKMKDLEGIDSSNIISEPRGRRSASASFFAPKYSPNKSDDESDDDKVNGNESANDDEDEADDGGGHGSSEGAEGEDVEEGGEEDAESDDAGGDESE